MLRLRAGAAVRSLSVGLLVATCLMLLPQRVSAQEHSSFFADTVKGVLLDPTTYAPAAIAYDATIRDWDSSQAFFRHGYFEGNERFTITGRANDIPISYGAGRSRILSDAVRTLEMSAINNVADRVIERMLVERYPQHRKMVKAFGWIERAAFASAMSYYLSAAHYRQAAANVTRAQQLGF